MSELIRAIIVMSVSGSILAALLFTLKPLLRDRLPKAAQYYLWLVVIAALLVPVSRIVTLPAGDISISGAVDRIVITNEEIFESIKPYEVVNEDGFIGIPIENQPIVDELIPEPWYVELWDWCAILWVLGAYVIAGYFLCAYIAFVEKIKRTNVPTETDCPVPVYRNAKVTTPMLIGLFCPAIVLPDREYTDEQLRAVLLHELTHLRRKDILVKWLSVLACAVHWFNPVVWLARREIDRACELSCDEAVIRDLDESGKHSYGETLLYVAADGKTPRAVLSTTMCEEKRDLKERLSAIMKSKKRTRAAVIASAAVICVAILAVCALGAGSENDQTGGTTYPIIWNGETERTYYLEGATDEPLLMKVTSITIYPDGTIKIPEPLLSSYRFPNSVYVIDGDNLLVYPKENAEDYSVRFKIVADGAIEFIENNLGIGVYMDVGARYVCKTIDSSEGAPGVPNGGEWAWTFSGQTSDSDHWFVASTEVALGSSQNYIFLSRDNGMTWEETNNVNDEWARVLNAAAFSDSETGFLCFRYDIEKLGPIYRTTDGGKTWRRFTISAFSSFAEEGVGEVRSLSFDRGGNGTLEFFYRNEGNEQLEGEIVALVSNDYGDGWEVDLELMACEKEEVSLADLPNVLKGEGFGIIEDVGGVWGLEELAKALKKGSGKKYDDFCAWLGSTTLDLETFDKDDMNFRLKKLMRVYKEIYEYHYAPTDRTLSVLLRKYQGKGSRGY